MSIALESGRHPLVAAAQALAEVLDQAAAGNPVYLSVAEKESVLVELTRARERVQGLLLGVLAAAEDVAAEHGARSAPAWLAHRTHADYGPAARQGRLAHALDARWHQLDDALVEGRVSAAQAEAIAHALDALPADVDASLLAKAQAHLVAEAAHHTPRQLRLLGRKVLEVVAPDTYDDHERRLLEAEEARAHRRAFLRLRPLGDGTTDLHARLPDATAERLRVYLDAHAAPRRRHLNGDVAAADPIGTAGAAERLLPYPTRLGQALAALLEHLPVDLLPLHGGSATTVVVTMGVDQLVDGLGAADLLSGGRISAGEARRLACTAGLIPAVLGKGSEVLDLGRSTRLFTPAQRKALALRDRECRAEGCSIPAAWCEAHHGHPWAKGGRTDLADGLLLCPHHHQRGHDSAYRLETLPAGEVRFHRRT
jgi:hypothetical protein